MCHIPVDDEPLNYLFLYIIISKWVLFNEITKLNIFLMILLFCQNVT